MSAPGLIVEPYSGPWREAVAGLIVPIQRGEFGVDITAEDQPDLADIPGFYQRGAGNFWIARRPGQEGELLGTIALLDIGSGMAALRKMFVRREERGAGVAPALLGAALAWAGERGLREIWLGTTDKYHAAHRFYEKHGFGRVSREELPPPFPVMAVDSIFYLLRP
jgi:GNAT superfamily N-acetyltransferase